MATRPVDHWLDSYAADHRNGFNQRMHVLCVPLILWSVIALLWCIPSPAPMFRAGVFAGLAMLAAALYYLRLSRPLALGMAAVFMLLGLFTRVLHEAWGSERLALVAVGVFVVAWIGQFVGHKAEGAKPSFLTDLTYLLIGPLWLLAKAFRRLGIAW